jgi:Protein of unknown function (DUF1295)
LSAVENRTISNASIFEENYFFEWCVWIGFAIYGLAYLPWGAIALVGQAIIVGSIFGVTGIPPTEKQAIRSKGDAYRAYQKRVSRFIPLPPKSRGSAVVHSGSPKSPLSGSQKGVYATAVRSVRRAAPWLTRLSSCCRCARASGRRRRSASSSIYSSGSRRSLRAGGCVIAPGQWDALTRDSRQRRASDHVHVPWLRTAERSADRSRRALCRVRRDRPAHHVFV